MIDNPEYKVSLSESLCCAVVAIYYPVAPRIHVSYLIKVAYHLHARIASLFEDLQVSTEGLLSCSPCRLRHKFNLGLKRLTRQFDSTSLFVAKQVQHGVLFLQGVWKPSKIANPDYFEDKQPLKNLADISAVAVEIWTMDEGYYFDNVLVSNQPEKAQEYREKYWAPKHEHELVSQLHFPCYASRSAHIVVDVLTNDVLTTVFAKWLQISRAAQQQH